VDGPVSGSYDMRHYDGLASLAGYIVVRTRPGTATGPRPIRGI
jgi:hypothetical protein